MTQWIYRATANRADWGTTVDSLENGFLCRIAYKKKDKRTGIHALNSNVEQVQGGDVIHVALSQDDQGARVYRNLGSFEILGVGHPDLEGPVEDATHGALSLRSVRIAPNSEL